MGEKEIGGESVRTRSNGNRWESPGSEFAEWLVQSVRTGEKHDGRAKGRQKVEGITGQRCPFAAHLFCQARELIDPRFPRTKPRSSLPAQSKAKKCGLRQIRKGLHPKPQNGDDGRLLEKTDQLRVDEGRKIDEM